METLDAIVAEASAFSEYDKYTCDAFRRIVTLAQTAQGEEGKQKKALEGFDHAPQNRQIIVSRGQVQRIRDAFWPS